MPTDSKKKYGLILASARRAEALSASRREGMRTLNPLKDSDEELERGDEEEEEERQQDSMDWVQATLKKSGGGNSAQLAQQQRLMREALQEDPSVFQYDEHYDNMQVTKDAAKEEKSSISKQPPKYIHNILKTAEKRKIEKERRTERKVQSEREAEKGLYDDKESFVTASYLKKLEELKKADEEDKYEQMLEEKTDVAKHKNMGIFYDHIFKQRMGEETIKVEPKDNETEEEPPAIQDVEIKKRNEKSKSNKYRRREDSNSPERTTVDPNLDADTDVEIDTDDSASDQDNQQKKDKTKRKQKHSSSDDSSSSSDDSSEDERSKSKKKEKSNQRKRSLDRDEEIKPLKKIKKENSSSDSEDSEDSKQEVKEEKKVKIESKETREERIKKLFTKRTVGDKFIEAQQKYFQRKAARQDIAASA